MMVGSSLACCGEIGIGPKAVKLPLGLLSSSLIP